jgi:transposase
MDLARYVVDAVVVEGRSYREVARAHGGDVSGGDEDHRWRL